jgi:hypothetical protein
MFEPDSVKLVDSLEKHVAEYFEKIDRNLFIAQLNATDFVSNGFYFSLKENEIGRFEQTVRLNKNAHQSLRLKYAIFNKVISEYTMSKAGAWLASLPSKMGFNIVPPELCSVASKPGIREILRMSESPFSVLGEYSLHYYGGSDKILYVSRRPVLVVPGAELHDTINKWESDNTKYYKEPGNPLSKGLKQIEFCQFPNTVCAASEEK